MLNQDQTKMVAIRLPIKLHKRLDDLSKRTSRTKAFFIREAIIDHLEEIEDYYDAIEAINEKGEYILAEDLWKKLDV